MTDLNGDGLADIIIGQGKYDFLGEENTGRIIIHPGTSAAAGTRQSGAVSIYKGSERPAPAALPGSLDLDHVYQVYSTYIVTMVVNGNFAGTVRITIAAHPGARDDVLETNEDSPLVIEAPTLPAGAKT